MPAKILVVDDEAAIVRLVQLNLQRQGYQISTASDGVEALEKMDSDRPDLVILDVTMPHMDGFEVLRRMKANPRAAGIRVIMLTAKAQDADVMHGMEMGADYYLTKPFNPMELIAFVRKALDPSENRASPALARV